MPVQSKDDISFGFNPQPFNNGIKEILKRLGVLKNYTVNTAKAMSMGFLQAAKKVAVFLISMRGIKGIINQIPEIGKAFGIAKEIVFKNFFFPLRQAVYPLLQKLLTWVRDNRKTFVIWGQALANVFNIVVSNLKNVMAFGKQLGGFFLNFINKIFGTQLRSFEELINMITFKIAVTLEFLKAMFAPIIQNFEPIIIGLGKLGSNILPIITGLITGFLNGVRGIEKYFLSILNSVNRILLGWTEIDSKGNRFNAVVKSISSIFGTILKFVTSIADSFLKGMVKGLIDIKQPIKDIAAAFDKLFNKPENAERWKEIFKGIGEVAGGVLATAMDILAKATEIAAGALEKIIEFFTSEGFKKFAAVMGGINEFLMFDWMFGKPKEMDNPFYKKPELKQIETPLTESQNQANKVKKAKDVIITKKGDIIQTDPEDNIQAYKKSPQNSKQVIIEKIDFSGMKIYTNGISDQEATKFSNNIVSMVIEQLNNELIREGIA